MDRRLSTSSIVLATLRKSMIVLSPPMPLPDSRCSSFESILVRLPPSISPVFERVQAFLNPTWKVTAQVRESFESGAQRQLAKELWEHACSGKPVALVWNAITKTWKMWRKDDD